jgi:hypothetical protein
LSTGELERSIPSLRGLLRSDPDAQSGAVNKTHIGEIDGNLSLSCAKAIIGFLGPAPNPLGMVCGDCALPGKRTGGAPDRGWSGKWFVAPNDVRARLDRIVCHFEKLPLSQESQRPQDPNAGAIGVK